MAENRVQHIRFNTTTADAFVPEAGEIVVDTTRNEIRLGDGSTAGGHRILNKAQNDLLYQALQATLTSLSGLVGAADKLAYFTALDTLGLTDFTAFARTILDDANAAAVATTLGLVIGTDVQAQDAELSAIAGLTSAADKLPYFTGSGAAALADLTAAARTVLDDATVAAMLATLGGLPLVGGTMTGDIVMGSGDGIDFAAIGGSIFNDYEEGGTFTPTLLVGGSSVGVTYGARAGRYTKVGNKVTLWVRMITTSIAALTGAITIGGLPFVANANNTADGPIGITAGLAITAGESVVSHLGNSATTIGLRVWSAVTGLVAMDETEWTADGDVGLTITYEI